jgi:hypothetical protein
MSITQNSVLYFVLLFHVATVCVANQASKPWCIGTSATMTTEAMRTIKAIVVYPMNALANSQMAANSSGGGGSLMRWRSASDDNSRKPGSIARP